MNQQCLKSSFFKRWSICFVVIAHSLMCAQNDPSEVAWVPKISTPPTIDGQIDPIWYAADAFSIAVLQFGEVENIQDLSAEWYGLWDDAYLYLLVDITDQFLESEAGTDDWRNDRIEVYFNMDNVKPGGSSFAGDNAQIVFHWNKPNGAVRAGIEWGQTTTDYGYIIEAKIPWVALSNQFMPEENESFGFDIAINDNDGNPTYDAVYYWWNSNGIAEFGNIDGAGTLGLGPDFDGNYSPQIAKLDTQITVEGKTSTIEIIATDPNVGDVITFSTENLPSFAQLEDHGNGTATISIHAQSGDANVYIFEVIASDGGKSDQIEVNLIVKDPNIPTQSPVIGKTGEVVVDQGNRRIVEVSVTDLDSLNVTIEGTELPDFATIMDNGNKTASITFSPIGATVAQNYVVTVKAMDADQNSDSVSFNVRVREPQELGSYYCDPVNGNLNNIGSAQSPWSSLEALMASGRMFIPGDTIYLGSGYHGAPRITGTNTGTVYITADENSIPTLSSVTFNGTSANWHLSNVSISPEFNPTSNANTLISISGEHNAVTDSNIFSAKNTSGWTATDWQQNVVHGAIVGGNNNLIENCDFTNVRDGVSISGSYNTLRKTRIQYFTVDAVRALGDDALYEYNYISDNINIDDNHDDAFQSWTLSKKELHRVIIRGNTIIESTDPNRPFQGSLQGLGLFEGMFFDWVIENNVIVVTAYHGIALYGARRCKIINNTVIDQNTNNNPGVTWISIYPHGKYSSNLSDEEEEYYLGGDNLVRNNLSTDVLASSNILGTFDYNVEVSPQNYNSYFVKFPLDLRLKSGSPAIDAGTNVDAPATDADGVTRPVDGDNNGSAITDLGAYEYGNTWRGVPANGNFVEINAKFGWLAIEKDPWVWSYNLNGWIYLSPAWTATDLGWIYRRK